MDYKLLARSGNNMVDVIFSGYYRNHQVVWHATIMTLKRYLKDMQATLSKPRENHAIRQFIEIPDDCESGHCMVKVGLHLDKIDNPAILKTIIMINNYKNLKVGIHEFGDAFNPYIDSNINRL